MKGAMVHQFTTVGAGAFITMGTKVRFDVLPFCVFDERKLLLDRVALQRSGRTQREADELQAFYQRHFSSTATHYIQEIDGFLPGPPPHPDVWSSAVLRRFFQLRRGMRDKRLLARFGPSQLEASLVPSTEPRSAVSGSFYGSLAALPQAMDEASRAVREACGG